MLGIYIKDNQLVPTLTSSFSFHAVKNFTTAEGEVLLESQSMIDDEEMYKEFPDSVAHGQTL